MVGKNIIESVVINNTI